MAHGVSGASLPGLGGRPERRLKGQLQNPELDALRVGMRDGGRRAGARGGQVLRVRPGAGRLCRAHPVSFGSLDERGRFGSSPVWRATRGVTSGRRATASERAAGQSARDADPGRPATRALVRGPWRFPVSDPSRLNIRIWSAARADAPTPRTPPVFPTSVVARKGPCDANRGHHGDQLPARDGSVQRRSCARH